MTESENAFAAVRDLAQTFSSNAQSLPAQKKIVETTKLIGFRLLGSDCVIALDEISEVLTPPEFTKLPRVKSWVRGVSNVRGRLLPVVDFAQYLGGTIAGKPREQRVLVIDLRGVYVGLLVDGVMGMKTLPVDQYSAAPVAGPLARYVEGGYMDGERCLALFRPLALLDDGEFMTVAA